MMMNISFAVTYFLKNHVPVESKNKIYDKELLAIIRTFRE
jgi:hypothetical protein